ncbi:hypothetical protein C8J56DRAFT_165846 [Mycena floridula]|nr:hypothetical protein C8J56DRAFT_165846 [Mycena floridula]
MTRPTLAAKEIRRAARAAIAALQLNNLECCLFGSAACSLYGTSRIPNDVDVVVLTDRDPESIKRLIVATNNNFYLLDPRDRTNTYKILWFRLATRRACKIDILIHNDRQSLNIPAVPVRRVVYLERFADLPVLPMLALILLKLQGWKDHRDNGEYRYQQKQYDDADDLDELLDMAVEDQTHLTDKEERWMPTWFLNQGLRRVEEFVEEFPDSQEKWVVIGFDV